MPELDQEWITAKTAAGILGCTHRTVVVMIHDRRLPGTKVYDGLRAAWLLRRTDVESFAQRPETEKPPGSTGGLDRHNITATPHPREG